MKRILALLTAAAMLCCAGCAAVPSPSPTDIPPSPTGEAPAPTQPPSAAAVAELTAGYARAAGEGDLTGCEGAADFAFALLSRAAGTDANAVCSPLSAYMALALLANGAEGETLAQIESLLGAPVDELNRICAALADRLTQTAGSTELSVASSVWADASMNVSQEFLRRAAEWYAAEAYGVQLSSDEALRAVNQWAEEKTNGLIKTVRDENFSPDTVLVLMNAVYLSAKWAAPFSANHTHEQTFSTADGTSVSVPFMHATRSMDYICADGVEGAVLPYDDGRTAFVALRSTEGLSGAQLAASLDGAGFAALSAGARSERVMLAIPKFDVEFALPMTELLQSMGMTDAFDPAEAQLGGLGSVGGERIFVSAVTQKVRLRVDEEGTEAAAVTVIEKNATSAMTEPPVELTLDSPFVYAVVDTETALVLFAGVMDSPAA